MNPILNTEPTTRHGDSLARGIFRSDVLAGLRMTPKQLPCKYFYDARGSELFDQICQLDEYYLTRSELSIMDQFAFEMGEQIGPGVTLVEFGSGSSVKTRYLLDGLPDPVSYVPVDISCQHLQQAARELERDYPHIEILPLCTDFMRSFTLPTSKRPATHTAVYFPGSTIGNFLPDAAAELLGRITQLCGERGGLLIGIDLKKELPTIEAAYNDRLGVTAEFNLNLLYRINRELGADFDIDRFDHQARYNTPLGRIEMHLISRCAQTVTIDDEIIEFTAGESICTEFSHKYTVDEFSHLAASVGLVLHREWTDRQRNFAVLHFVIADQT